MKHLHIREARGGGVKRERGIKVEGGARSERAGTDDIMMRLSWTQSGRIMRMTFFSLLIG